ncbi:DMT family transporter [Kovacikia minuta CCNUW1]|uniref:DMT family transporter n=1 Tax=Kovacikia minuta TaxID=2931930 RepID=UPI001CCFC8A6|nr:DMT family transporter [Kovacikia minuta]UBF27813.1 DMT family transporter [Kovacikia minuta CCNUW1]
MAKPESAQWTAIVALLALALIWGNNWVQMKVAVHYAPPLVFAAIRVFLGALSLFAMMVVLRKPLAPREIQGTLWVGLLQITGVYGLATWALESGGAGKTSVLVYTMPFWTVMLAWIFLGDRIRGLQWVAIGLSLVGLFFILEPQNLQGGLFSKTLAILAGVCWGGGAIVAKKLRQTVDLDLLSFTAWQMLFAAVPLILVALLVPAAPINWTPQFVFALIYNVIPGTAIATLLWLFVLNQLPAGTAGLGLLLNPIVAVFSAWIQLGEQPGLVESVGMLLIAIALILNALHAMRSSLP